MDTRPSYDLLYEIAESQAGYFTAGQARKVGFSWERLSGNARVGRFHRIARGIYRLAHFPGSPHEDLFVAWLRTGPHSTISYESALSVYELSDVLPGEVHVIVPRTASRRRKGIRLHTNRLKADETAMREGLPVTTVARTIGDVAHGGLAHEQVLQAIQDALGRGLTTTEELLAQAERRGGRVEQIIRSVLEGDSET
jgi:predicted transcriptional regulator of viral defense system